MILHAPSNYYNHILLNIGLFKSKHCRIVNIEKRDATPHTCMLSFTCAVCHSGTEARTGGFQTAHEKPERAEDAETDGHGV